MGHRSRHLAWLLTVLCVAAASLAGCGDDDDGGGGGGDSQQIARVKVGILPIGNVAPMFLGVEKGFFREERIEVEPQVVQSGNEVITAMVSGANEFGFAGYVPAMVAAGRDIPVKVVANADNGASTDKEEWTKIVVPGDSSIRSVDDLAGKTIASNSLKGVGEVVIKASLEEQGVDPNSIKLLEVPFPDMPAALERKQVDAVWITEPFLTQVLASGARAVDAPLTTLGKEYPNAAYLVTEKYLAENEDAVERFVRAMNRSLDYARANPDEARAVIPEFTQIPPDVAEAMLLPHWPTEIDRAQLEELQDYATKYEVVTGEVNLDDLIWEGAATAD